MYAYITWWMLNEPKKEGNNKKKNEWKIKVFFVFNFKAANIIKSKR